MLYETNAPTADMTDAINAFNARYRGTDVGDTIWEQNNPEIFSELSLDEMPPLVDTTEPLRTEVTIESGLDDNTFHGPNCECWNQEEHDHFCTIFQVIKHTNQKKSKYDDIYIIKGLQ